MWTLLCTIRSRGCQELREGCTSRLPGTLSLIFWLLLFTFSSEPSTRQRSVPQKRHSESCQSCHGNGSQKKKKKKWNMYNRLKSWGKDWNLCLSLLHSSSFTSSAASKVRNCLPRRVTRRPTRRMHRQSGKLHLIAQGKLGRRVLCNRLTG